MQRRLRCRLRALLRRRRRRRCGSTRRQQVMVRSRDLRTSRSRRCRRCRRCALLCPRLPAPSVPRHSLSGARMHLLPRRRHRRIHRRHRRCDCSSCRGCLRRPLRLLLSRQHRAAPRARCRRRVRAARRRRLQLSAATTSATMAMTAAFSTAHTAPSRPPAQTPQMARALATCCVLSARSIGTTCRRRPPSWTMALSRWWRSARCRWQTSRRRISPGMCFAAPQQHARHRQQDHARPRCRRCRRSAAARPAAR